MIFPAVLLGCLVFAGAQRTSGWPHLESWESSYPEIYSPRLSELVYKDNKEYKYLYEGQILTGLPETANQYSGLRIRAILTVQLRSGRDIFQIERASLGKLNEQVVRGPLALQPVDLFEEIPQEEAVEFEAALTKPIRFEYNNGVITDMESLESDPVWSVNIKRAILATFNLKLKNQALLQQRTSPFLTRFEGRKSQNDVQVFTAMEEGIGGECEALYLVQSLPRNSQAGSLVTESLESPSGVLNVTKSWDYTKCRNRPLSIESLGTAFQCPLGKANCDSEDKKNKIVESGAQTRYNIIGNPEQYVIESATTEGVHKFAPYGQEAGSLTAYINATIRLIYSGSWNKDLLAPLPKGISVRGLRQLMAEWKSEQKGYFAEEADKLFAQERSEYPNVIAKKTLVTSLLSRLVEDIADDIVEPESADLVFQMTVILQHATPVELDEVHEEVKKMSHRLVEHEQIRKLWLDILAAVGTKPAIKLIKREILASNLKGLRAAQVLSTLAFSARKPDADVVQELLELCKSPEMESSDSVKRACWLTVGSLVHKSCVKDEDTISNVQNVAVRINNPRCTAEAKQRFLMELLARLKRSDNEDDQILLLKTLGNAALNGMSDDIKAIIADDTKSISIRVAAIHALHHVAKRNPKLVVNLLLPEYHDVKNHYQVRIAAFNMIMETRPDRPELVTIARNLQTEKSIQVGSFVWSKLNTMANATHPCFKDLAEDATFALEFAKPFNTGLTFSKGLHFDGFSKELKFGGYLDIDSVAEPSSIFPRSLRLRAGLQAVGLSQDTIEVGFRTEGLEAVSSIIKKLVLNPRTSDVSESRLLKELLADEDLAELELERELNQNNLLSRKLFGRQNEMDEIDRVLGLKERSKNKLKGNVYMKIYGQEVNFLPLSPRALKKLVKEAVATPRDIFQLMQGQKDVDLRKALMLNEAKLTIPTELGLPLTVELKMPTVLSLKGSLGLKQLSSSFLLSGEELTVQSNLKASLASRLLVEMNSWAGYVKIGSALVTRLSAALPLEGEISLNPKSGKLSTSIELPQKPQELLRLETTPITFTKVFPKSLVPHQPDLKSSSRTYSRSAKTVQYNRQTEANEEPNKFVSYRSELLEEKPFMLWEDAVEPTNFYRGLAVPIIESKEVPTQKALQTKSIKLKLGHPALAGALEVKGNLQLPYGLPAAPLVPLGGKSKLVVLLKPAENGLTAIDMALYLRRKTFLGSSEPELKSLYDQLVGSRVADLVEKLRNGLPMALNTVDKSGMSLQLILQGRSQSTQELALQAVVSLIEGLDGKFVKVAAELHSPSQRLPFQLCFHGQSTYPAQYDVEELLPGRNHPVIGQYELAVGQTCQSPAATKIFIKMQGEKSAKQLAIEKNDYYDLQGSIIPVLADKVNDPLVKVMKPLQLQCERDRKQGLRLSKACLKAKELYSMLMQLKVEIDYQNVPFELQQLLQKAECLVLSKFYWNSEVDTVRVENPQGKVTIMTDIVPGEQRVNVLYSTPKKDVKLFNLPMPLPLVPLATANKPLSLLDGLLQERLEETCSMSGNQLRTLDEAEMTVPLTQCYHLLAKDCSPEERWSVLFAPAGALRKHLKIVKAYLGNRKIELIPAEAVSSRLRSVSDLVVKVDGIPVVLGRENEEIKIDQDISIEVEKTLTEEAPLVIVKAEELGLKLIFDGQNVAVKPSFALRDQVCGLCGNNNGELLDEMMLPTGQPARNIEELIRGYTVRQDGCVAEPMMLPLEPARISRECQPRTLIKYRPGQICFSVEPLEIPQAELSLDRELEFTQMRRQGFHCLPEDSTVAQRLEREVKLRILTEIANKPVTDMFLVPDNSLLCGLESLKNDRVRQFKKEWL